VHKGRFYEGLGEQDPLREEGTNSRRRRTRRKKKKKRKKKEEQDDEEQEQEEQEAAAAQEKKRRDGGGVSSFRLRISLPRASFSQMITLRIIVIVIISPSPHYSSLAFFGSEYDFFLCEKISHFGFTPWQTLIRRNAVLHQGHTNQEWLI